MPNTLKAPASLTQFQDTFSHQLKDQRTPFYQAGVPKRRAEIYRELVYNNVCGFVDKCFPVTRSLLSQEAWQEMLENFFRTSSLISPLFTDIPKAFVQHYASNHPYKEESPWLSELLHYEWIELEVDLHQGLVPTCVNFVSESAGLKVNPTVQLQCYQWPVHHICKEYLPTEPTQTHLLIYRDEHHQTQFIELNPLTSQLIKLIYDSPGLSSTEYLNQLSNLNTGIDENTIHQFGQAFIKDLIHTNVINTETEGSFC